MLSALQTLVQRAWGFVCQCSRCTADFDDTRVFNCPKCTADEKEGYLYAGSQDHCPGETDAAEKEQDPHEGAACWLLTDGGWWFDGGSCLSVVYQRQLAVDRRQLVVHGGKWQLTDGGW